MANSLQPGAREERLPGGISVIRLGGVYTSALPSDYVTCFDLSSEDKASDLQSLSIWAEDITSAEEARQFMHAGVSKYEVALYLVVDAIRAIELPREAPTSSLDVVWDPLLGPKGEGHAGIIGLMRPSGLSKEHYKGLRAKLALIARPERLLELS